jgi:drug/metabolite transporter (DMT)-like permease
LLLAAAVLFSTGGAVIKSTSLTAWQVAGFRSAIAALALTVLIPAARRAWRPRHFAVGAAYAATLILFVSANKLTTAANTIFLQSTAPLYILLLGPWWLGERVRGRDIPFLAVMASGCAAFFIGEAPPTVTAPDPMTGDLLALLSGLAWALTVTGLRWVSRQDPGDTLVTVVVGNWLAFGVCLPFAWPVLNADAGDWTALLWLGVFQIGVAYFCLTRGVERLTALETSLLLLAEPVLNPVWAWLFQGERPSKWALAGGAVILVASTVRTVSGAAGALRASGRAAGVNSRRPSPP